MCSAFFYLVTGLTLAGSACAEQWFTVASPDTQPAAVLVEIDLDTVRTQDGGGEGMIRVTSDALQPYGLASSYRSFVAHAQFNCGRRTITLNNAAYFSLPGGQGNRLNADSLGGQPETLHERMPTHVRQALLKAICSTGSSN